MEDIGDSKKIKKITLLYDYLPKSDILYFGDVKYVVELENEKGYILQRYASKKYLYSGARWDVSVYLSNEKKLVKRFRQHDINLHQKRLILYQK